MPPTLSALNSLKGLFLAIALGNFACALVRLTYTLPTCPNVSANEFKRNLLSVI